MLADDTTPPADAPDAPPAKPVDENYVRCDHASVSISGGGIDDSYVYLLAATDADVDRMFAIARRGAPRCKVRAPEDTNTADFHHRTAPLYVAKRLTILISGPMTRRAR